MLIENNRAYYTYNIYNILTHRSIKILLYLYACFNLPHIVSMTNNRNHTHPTGQVRGCMPPVRSSLGYLKNAFLGRKTDLPHARFPQSSTRYAQSRLICAVLPASTLRKEREISLSRPQIRTRGSLRKLYITVIGRSCARAHFSASE